jgi:hypothetical protein
MLDGFNELRALAQPGSGGNIHIVKFASTRASRLASVFQSMIPEFLWKLNTDPNEEFFTAIATRIKFFATHANLLGATADRWEKILHSSTPSAMLVRFNNWLDKTLAFRNLFHSPILVAETMKDLNTVLPTGEAAFLLASGFGNSPLTGGYQEPLNYCLGIDPQRDFLLAYPFLVVFTMEDGIKCQWVCVSDCNGGCVWVLSRRVDSGVWSLHGHVRKIPMFFKYLAEVEGEICWPRFLMAVADPAFAFIRVLETDPELKCSLSHLAEPVKELVMLKLRTQSWKFV